MPRLSSCVLVQQSYTSVPGGEMSKYAPEIIENKWQDYWSSNNSFVSKEDPTKPKYYVCWPGPTAIQESQRPITKERRREQQQRINRVTIHTPRKATKSDQAGSDNDRLPAAFIKPSQKSSGTQEQGIQKHVRRT